NNSYSLKVGYKLTDKHKISAEIKGRVRKNNNERINTNKITINNTEDNTLQSDSELHRTMDFQIMNLTYSYIDTLGKSLKISGTTTNFDFNNEDFVDEKYLTTNEILKRKSQGNNGINIYLGKIDYEQPLLNDFVKFETGVKYATSKNKSETDYFIQQQDQWIGNPQYKSGFDYRETNSAAYVNFKKEINKLNLRAGLRYESNHSTASSVNSGAFLDTVYNNFFPSLGAEYKFTDEITLDLALTNRIKRPNFQDLDPYVIYLDSFSLIKGSPDLRPEIVTGVETNLSYSGYPLLTIGYSKTTNPIYILVESDETNPLVNIGISRNLNYENVFNMQIVLPYQNDWWTSANGFGYNRKELQFSKFNNGLPFLKKEYFVFSYQDFNIKGWNFGAQYVWFSPGIEGIFEYGSGSELNAWVGKKFFDGKLKIRLLFNDILKSSIVTSKSQIGNIFFQQRGYYDSRRARIVFTYKFGKLKTSQKENNSSSSEFDRIKLD
ncbi:MAG TPA: TonB-dependent receptor, partial [Saprospiraceae bacterium]|nr:TonB-dependent receptor [Saprospiraceae bacterium]